MFFNLCKKTDEENLTTSRLTCEVLKRGDDYIVEFTEFIKSDVNKWNKKDVLTDVKVTLFYLPEIFKSISSRMALETYIRENWNKNPRILNQIEELSKSKCDINISFPTSYQTNQRGVPTSLRPVKDSFLPLIVDINGKDVSRAFVDFSDFGDDAVRVAYQALVLGQDIKSEKDIFSIDEVVALHESLLEESEI